MSEIAALAARPMTTVTDVDDVLAHPHEMLAIITEREAEVVKALERVRDSLQNRTVPVFLFLLDEGEGQRALSGVPALASWIRGLDFGGEGTVDIESERRRFSEIHRKSPEEWLTEWRSGLLEDTLANSWIANDALLLESRS